MVTLLLVDYDFLLLYHVTMLGGSLSPQHGASLGCEWRDGLQLWRIAANTLNKQPQTNLRVGRGDNNLSP
jgi:hypothetical protein